MVALVTLDLYQTLCHAVPTRLDRLAQVCCALGITCQPGHFARANVLAEDLYTVENGRHPLHMRPSEERSAFYRSMMVLLLREAGLPSDPETAERVRAAMEALPPARWELFDDVRTTIAELRRRGLGVGIISNTPVDATILCDELGLCPVIDFVVSSCLVGCEKPCPEIFRAALERAGVRPEDAVHVGDQPRSDALGAVGVGMHALLLDRFGLLEHEQAYERIRSLADVPGWIDSRVGAASL